MNRSEQLVEMILMNNPWEVSGRLATMGVIEEGEIYEPEDLKTLIHETASYEMGLTNGDPNAYWNVVAAAVDVPVDHQGPYAAEILRIQTTHGNHALLRGDAGFLPSGSISLPDMGVWMPTGLLGWLLVILAILGIIHLIRKF